MESPEGMLRSTQANNPQGLQVTYLRDFHSTYTWAGQLHAGRQFCVFYSLLHPQQLESARPEVGTRYLCVKWMKENELPSKVVLLESSSWNQAETCPWWYPLANPGFDTQDPAEQPWWKTVLMVISGFLFSRLSIPGLFNLSKCGRISTVTF